ncbi:hypothetical protein FN846DRAFT_102541 [Sphaerosporella brunnea]|uniref:C2 domain-containing protein n=1 Tax=Sphaerosporella brunnea TaxID=1250544 RepID=A0A5J5F9W4_9PEZI|nr:hypothetical protein FN846DRAFT_102541 [Sphaerosporella brunnea]
MVRAGIKEAHPAGIWSDMSSDGPVIGTLVVVLDRAKNLPNKKKIGKQDPYAVARLAKEAKRTDTDVRGGQVPRWDKELRFPVRDSPDYKTMKVSVFNDDKKTDLIGECTIRLDRILVPGGGTDDGWRGLKCKDKYAGEILVELTFWDLRPKEKTRDEVKKTRRITAFEDKEANVPRPRVGGAREMGPREKAGTSRRRPLPASPVLREPSSSGEERERRHKERSREERRTRKSRHSHHPDSRPKSSHHPSHVDLHHEYARQQSQPPQPRERRRREHRPDPSQRHSMIDINPRHSMVMAPQGYDLGGRPEIYDPGDYVPGPTGRLDDYQGDPYSDQPPPPPPPAHRSFQGVPPPMDPSMADGVADLPPELAFQKQLRHYQSVPAFQQPSLNHRHSFDPRGLQHLQQFHQLQQFTPTYPEANFIHQPSPRHSPNVGYDPVPFEDDIPPLAHVPTPESSNPGSRDGPPPPPPPHRQPVNIPSPVMDEPNWDNHRPKSAMEEYGLPSYESLQPAEPRRPSFDVAQRRSGIPLPPSLIPGMLQIEAPPAPLQPLQQRSRTNYHRPQVEEVQDVQLYGSGPSTDDLGNGPQTVKKKNHTPLPPMVKPMPIHGERDSAVPAVNAGPSAIRKASVLNLRPERKPVPQSTPPADIPGTLGGIPFGPDSYDAINPNPIASLDALTKHAPPDRMIVPGSNRVYDPSDVLGPETYAPEPEQKRRAPRPPPPVPVEHRRERVGRGSVSPVPAPRGPRLSLPAPQVKQVSFESAQAKIEKARNKLYKSVRASKSVPKEGQRSLKDRYSMNDALGGMVLFDPQSERERVRQMERERIEGDSKALVPARSNDSYGYSRPGQPRGSGMEVGYYGRGSGGPPPVPAKIPLRSQPPGNPREEVALSQELSLISIGAGDGGLRTRERRY